MAKFEIETLLGLVGGMDPLGGMGGGMFPQFPTGMGMGMGMGMQQSWDGNAGYGMQNAGGMYMGQGFPQVSQEGQGYYNAQQYPTGYFRNNCA